MKFFFPDSQDLVDPSFDFENETRNTFRVRQRDDIYAHEVFSEVPYTGILVSKTSVDGIGSERTRYSLAQKHRLLRVGVREFFRLDAQKRERLETIGDCGAFSYAKEPRPPFSVDEVIDFYTDCGFDYGVSIDHVIFEYDQALDATPDQVPDECRQRQQITLQLADEFQSRHAARKCRFEPMGGAQGWSPDSYAHSVVELEKMGYTYIGLGGLVPLKTPDILAVLERVAQVKKPETRLHLFGITRIKEVLNFQAFGVASFDSTSPLRQAFKDDRDNYYTLDRTYTAIRVPQIEGNASLKRRITAGKINQDEARELEGRCLDLLKRFDRGEASLDETVDALRSYEELFDGKRDRSAIYREILEHSPWKSCSCDICRDLGVHVIMFRGAERNRRRGFHNVFIFNQRLRREMSRQPATVG
ncbi:MAG: tRNA-guanine transglycosylase DpdA [Vulcanimicrobiota bacterium]